MSRKERENGGFVMECLRFKEGLPRFAEKLLVLRKKVEWKSCRFTTFVYFVENLFSVFFYIYH